MTTARLPQNRTTLMRHRIASGAIRVLAAAGVAGLTHRAVAKAAGISLAATTYHFETKADILAAASRDLFDGYLADFARLAERMAKGDAAGIGTLDDLVQRVVLNALGRDRERSLAWCEILLHGGRDSAAHATVQAWYAALHQVWSELARRLEPGADDTAVRTAIDLVIGLTFLLHPLALPLGQAEDLIAGRRDLADCLAGLPDAPADPAPDRAAGHRVVQAAIDILTDKGAFGITYGSVAERAGLSRSAPAHHFPTIDALLAAAQQALFVRAKARYRAGLASARLTGLSVDALLDLTTAILFREALEHPGENLAYYSAWIRAAQSADRQTAVAEAQRNLHRAWLRRLEALPPGADRARAALRLQALFIGTLLRAITTGARTETLAQARAGFATILRATPAAPSR